MKTNITGDTTEEVSGHGIMELFEELSFHEKWRRVADGLRMPPNTGEYKWARLQVTRLWSPAAGVTVPLVLLLLLTLLATGSGRTKHKIEIILRDADPEPPVLIDPEAPKEEPQKVPDVAEHEGYIEIKDDETMADAEPNPPDVFAPKPARFESVANIVSPIHMVGIYPDRDPGGRRRAYDTYHAPEGSECAVMRALRWLKKNQNSDGSWNACKPAMTSLALLTFLAHGETPASGEFGLTVEYAIKWLMNSQEAGGRFRGRDQHDYSQPIAAYALAEAYGLTRVPMLKEAAERAINVVIKGQNPSGGFNYNLTPGGGTRDDSSYMAWCSQALKAAYIAGLNCDGLDQAMTKAVAGWKKNYGGTYDQGGFGYTGPSSNHGLSSAGALSMQLLGQGDSKEVTSAMNAMENAGYWGNGSYSKVYYSYYLTQAKFHEGGVRWKAWNKIFSPSLIQNQIVEKAAIRGPGGSMKDIGHWAPGKDISGHTDSEGRVMNTCLSALQLQVYYRYLPTFQTPEIVHIENIADQHDNGVDIRIDGA